MAAKAKAHSRAVDAKEAAHIAKAHKKIAVRFRTTRIVRGAAKEKVWARPVRGAKAAAEEEAPEEKKPKKKGKKK